MPEGISEEKKQWMDSVGIKRFIKPYKYFHQPKGDRGIDMVYTEEYLKNTPLEKLQERHQRLITFDERLAKKLAAEQGRNSESDT